MPGTDYAMICDDVDVRAPKTRYKHHLATSTPTMREAFRAAAARWRHLYIRAVAKKRACKMVQTKIHEEAPWNSSHSSANSIEQY